MAVLKITWNNKVTNQGQTIEGKFFSSDANQLKSVINSNADELLNRPIRNANEIIGGLWTHQQIVNYGGDYSALFQDHTLVTKKWVTDNFGQAGIPNLQQVLSAGSTASVTGPVVIQANNIGFQLRTHLRIGREDGTFVDPSIYFNNDLRTYINSTDDTFTFEFQGTDRQKFRPDGRVIGAAAQNNNEFVIKSQLDAAIAGVGVPTLQAVSAQGNVTSNSLKITGNSNANLTNPGLIFLHSSTESTITRISPVIANLAQLSMTDDYVSLGYDDNSATSIIINRVETTSDAKVSIGGRTAGLAAINPNEYVTKQQLDTISYNFQNGLRETNGIVKLGLDSTTLGTTNIGALTEDTYLLRGDVASNNYSLIQIQTNDILVGGRTTDIGSVTIQQSGPNNVVSSIRLSDNDLVLGFGQTGGNSRTITFGGASNAGIEIIDQHNLGLTYNANYYANGSLNDRWIPDWGAVKLYVDNSGGSSYIFENGLREEDGVVKIGLDTTTIGTTNKGVLTEPTLLVIGNLSAGELSGIRISDVVTNITTSVGVVGTIFQTEASRLTIRKTNVSNETQQIIFSEEDDTIVVTDDINSKGIEYAEDYSANWTDHSLVTKKWVTDNFNSSTGTFVTIDTAQNITGTKDFRAPILFNGNAVGTGRISFVNASNAVTQANAEVSRNGNHIAIKSAGGTGTALLSTTNITGGSGIQTYALPNKSGTVALLDDIVVSNLDFSNGLRESNNTVKLGLDISTIGTTNDGILTEDTYLLFGDLVTSNYRVLNISPNSVMVGGKTTNNNNGLFTYVVANDQIYLQILRQTDVSAEEEQALNFGNPGTSSELISIKDTKENFGMKYENDYSPLGTTDDRWIPDYGAVKALVQNNTNYYDPELF